MAIRRTMGLVPGFKTAAPCHVMIVSPSTTQTVSATTWTDVEFAVDRDIGGWYDTTNYEWTPTHTGLYIHNLNVQYVAAEYSEVRFYDVTGTAVLYHAYPVAAAGGGSGTRPWEWQWWCEGGNTYTVQVYTSSASEIATNSSLHVLGPLVVGSE